MSANFAFYVHHHGSGHLMRALSIASKLKDARVTFLGSGLSKFERIIPQEIQCIHLPSDVAGQEDAFADKTDLSFLHYVPMNVQNVAKRTAMITTALHNLFPTVLIVDVSVEVTVLATLCGIPTVVIRQNGNRDDSPHLHAYECAQLLIAPSPEQMMNASLHTWVNEKTFHSGGFSKYSGNIKPRQAVESDAIGVIVGSGGTSIDGAVIHALALQCADKTIHVIGEVTNAEEANGANVTFHGQLDEPANVISKCNVIVGNAGHNTVMEMADLRKKFVCIPEERPFQEQLKKAELLDKNEMAVVIQPEELKNADRQAIIQRAEELQENCWQGVVNDAALDSIAEQLRQLWQRNFER